MSSVMTNFAYKYNFSANKEILMAVDITLSVYNASDTKIVARINLYFGKALNSLSSRGWAWVETQGMTIYPPNFYESPDNRPGHIVRKSQLAEWIENGYLSRTPTGPYIPPSFLNSYPPDAIFRLRFVDWS